MDDAGAIGNGLLLGSLEVEHKVLVYIRLMLRSR